MDTKLTLKLNKDVIRKVKLYATKHDISLSKMVETYFLALISEDKTSQISLSPLVKELSGVIEIPSKFDNHKEYTDYLINKYQ